MPEQQTLDQFITTLYTGMLDRAPEPGAVQAWRDRVESGASIQTVTTEFLNSQEFRSRKKYNERLFVPPGHFYSPIVDVDAARSVFERPIPRSVPGIAIDAEQQYRTWKTLAQHLVELPFPDARQDGFRYHYTNPAFGIGDASIYFAMLLEHRPRRIIEIGSGYSSACALDTIERHFDHPVDMLFIEPYPELLESLMTANDRHACRILPCPAQRTDLRIFKSLEAGDILFIDSTHVLKTDSDVHFELFEILPSLNPGVIVHIHDMFWPFEYPKSWVIDEGRSWNELYAVRALLMYQTTLEIMYFNDYAAHHLRHAIEADCPRLLENTGGSLWLRKTGPG